MNSEAISGIKKAAALCQTSREKAIARLKKGIQLEEILDEINSLPAIEAKSDALPAPNQVGPSEILCVHISAFLDSWTAKCSFSYYSGNRTELTKLLETNREAVISTAKELCPGFNESDIHQVIDLYKEEFDFTPNATASKSKLKAGDIIIIEAKFILDKPKLENIASAFHRETVLITANGAEILTRK